ncbi:MAG TPA: hypothetical protein VL122_10960 [Nitrospirota bacterium]|nr:hypothetical protein [Nitrospirota bacterium]
MDDDKTSGELARLRSEVKRLRKALTRQSPSLFMLLKRRGFMIYKKEPAENILVPFDTYLTSYYHMLHKYSFRLFLRDVIRHQDQFTVENVARYATQSVTKEYLDYLQSIKLVRKHGKSYTLTKRPITSFGETLEWYVTEIFRREFGAEAAWGVKFRRPNIGGDYDVIAKIDDSLLYGEVKSSPPKQIYDSEIAAFLDRVADLAPAISIFLMDTELRMTDKLVPMFEKELQRRNDDPPRVIRMERELFQIRDRIFIINARESILQNLEKVMSWYYRKTSGLS